MLVRFRIGDFLSFKEIQEFSMIKGKPKNKAERIYEKSDVKLLKFAAVFGANASGKSNLVSAMMYAQEMIVKGRLKMVRFGAFKLDEQYEDMPSYFEFEIIIEGENYAYGFEIILKKQQLVAEWLIRLSPEGDERNYIIFERDILNATFDTDIKNFVSEKNERRFQVYSEDIQGDDTLLFLREMNRREKQDLYEEELDLQAIRNVFLWLGKALDVNYPDRPISDYSYFKDVAKQEEICRIISSLGTGITNYLEKTASLEQLKNELPTDVYERLTQEIAEETSRGKGLSITIRINEMYYLLTVDKDGTAEVTTIAFNHGSDTEFFFSEESDGTQRILDLLDILFSNEGETYVIDEIDRSLHPCLTYKFVQEYLRLAAKRDLQLIVTTHESRLLDFGLLRQDEIWIANKNLGGATELYSLDEFNVRFDKKVDKAYLEGRYGGVPIFDTIFPVEGE